MNDETSSSSRRQSRELALQVLFQQEFAPNLDFHKSLENFRGSFAASTKVWKYAEELLSGIRQNQEAIDRLIAASASNWTINRMALVDLNLMRLAVFEMVFCTEAIPPPVAINEAVEITKKYGTTESAKFINGILDQVAHREA